MKVFSNFTFLLACFIIAISFIKILIVHYKRKQNHRGILVCRLLIATAVAAFLLLFFIHYGFVFLE